MKKIFGFIVILLFIFSFSACGTEPPLTNEAEKGTETKTTTESISDTGADSDPDASPKIPAHQELTASEATFDPNTMMRVSIPEVGLEDVVICDASSYDARLDEHTNGQVYLLGDDRRGRVMMDHYLLIAADQKMIAKDLAEYKDQFNHGGCIELFDLDGDGDCEILLQQTVGMVGGFGSYLSRVFDYKDGEIVELFTTDDIWEAYGESAGFSITLHEDQQFTIENEITGYRETFRLENRNPEYFKYWYSENGEIFQKEIMVDSYYEFLPTDTDGDGVYEIACRQYVSLIGHNDGIGCAKTVLKYNIESSAFEIISSSFSLEYYG